MPAACSCWRTGGCSSTAPPQALMRQGGESENGDLERALVRFLSERAGASEEAAGRR